MDSTKGPSPDRHSRPSVEPRIVGATWSIGASEDPPGRRLTSLGRAASEAAVIKRRRGVEYLDLPCRTLLNRCTNEQMPFDWSVNPYRGCELGCRYCYARYTHEFMGLEESALFETRIFAKSNAADVLESELARGRTPGGGIAIGTVTDPYQPAERSLRVTRRLLEVLARSEGLSISITTKSDLITRDVDLLNAIRRRSDLSINISITTLSRKLSRLLEPRAPRPARRLEALRALAAAGIRAGVFIMPVLPGITDAPRSLESIVAAAARAGASHLVCQALFLRTSAKKTFYPFLSEHFSRLSPRYRKKYAASAYYSEEYRVRLAALVSALKRQYKFASRPKGTGALRQGERTDLPAERGWRPSAVASAQLALGF
jgi:DNA repair photolyase